MVYLGVLGLLSTGCEVGVSNPVDDAEHNRTNNWSCTGTVGKTIPHDNSLYVTSFGCWIDENGRARGDVSDNCIPWCSSGAARHGTQDLYDDLCGGKTGKKCEQDVAWFSADADRYGCMTRLKVTNPDNGKTAVVVVLDRGPNCRIERKVDHWVLDLSYPATNYLFGGQRGPHDRADVIVEIVPEDTPLGPYAGDTEVVDSWVGDSCIDDAECDFVAAGENGNCDTWFDSDANTLRGMCVSECNGFCPNVVGFDPAACADIGNGQGNCLPIAATFNNFCEDIPAATPRPLTMLGSSTTQTVCATPHVQGITCEANGEAGECIDTSVSVCSGQLHTGACPGAANIRCCTP
jgi:hypothetical protein